MIQVEVNVLIYARREGATDHSPGSTLTFERYANFDRELTALRQATRLGVRERFIR